MSLSTDDAVWEKCLHNHSDIRGVYWNLSIDLIKQVLINSDANIGISITYILDAHQKHLSLRPMLILLQVQQHTAGSMMAERKRRVILQLQIKTLPAAMLSGNKYSILATQQIYINT